VLVTGGAGFIGSHLSNALLARGDEVVCLDNLDDFYDPAVKRRNLTLLNRDVGFTFLEGDIRDTERVQRLGKTHSIDAIMHLAARAGVRPSICEPALYADVNLGGTSNLLELAREHSIRNFVFASSSSVYGERRDIPFRESDPVDHPVSPYAATKKAGELLGYTYHHLYDLNVTCLRLFTVYGPRQRPEMAIHKFTRLIHAGESIPLYGDGSARRDFTYIDDIVDGMVRSLDQNHGYSIYNLGNHRMVSLRELIELISTALGKDTQVQELPPQPGDVSQTCAEITLAQDKLGYAPSTSIEQGVEQFVEWYQKEQAQT
ncbi:MAG: GDP-mannose 4,6-dehydratase, partial [Planctomycetota bacterium]